MCSSALLISVYEPARKPKGAQATPLKPQMVAKGIAQALGDDMVLACVW